MKRALWIAAGLVGLLSIVAAISLTLSMRVVDGTVGLLSPRTPPRIFEEAMRQVRSGEAESDSSRLLDILSRKFPNGSDEDALRTELADQGFKLARLAYCGASKAEGRRLIDAQCAVPFNSAIYQWRVQGCDNRIYVDWSAEQGKLADLRAMRSVSCMKIGS